MLACGPAIVYRAIAPMAPPSAQSAHATALPGALAAIESEVCRQLPAALNCHQAGGAVGNDRSTRDSRPVTPRTVRNGTNDAEMTSEPVFVLQANVLFATPPSPQQAFHRRLSGPASAGEAVKSRNATAQKRARGRSM